LAPPSSTKSHTMLIVAVVVVVIIVILAVIAFAFLALGSQAHITIDVHSTHILYTVDYTLYVDGRVIDSGTLGPMSYITYDYTYRWASGDPTVATFSATSTGGGFGSQSDYTDLTVSDGGAYSVSLYI
jgi:hypothetical protein